MKILILTNNYYPLKNANELCVYNIIQQIENASFYIVSLSEKEETIKIDNSTIFCLDKHRLKRKISNIYLQILCELPFRILSLIYRPVLKRRIVNEYIKKSDEIIKQFHPDAIIAVVNPINSLEAAYILKKKYPKIKFVIYDIDSLSNCNFGILENFPIIKNLYLKSAKKYENKVFSIADLIIHFNCHKSHFNEDFYKRFLHKTLFLGVPVLNLFKSFKENTNKDFIYSGRFYGQLRDPKILINIFEKVFERTNSKLHIYTNGDYVINIPKALNVKHSDCAKNILVHNYVEQKELNKITDKIGFLVSLGNSYTDMFPSKIVSYVSSLKPIIHIYQNQNDPVIEFLRKYPDALLINSKDSLETNADKIIAFVNSKRPIIRSDYIMEVYKDNLPEYNAREIMNFLNNLGK